MGTGGGHRLGFTRGIAWARDVHRRVGLRAPGLLMFVMQPGVAWTHQDSNLGYPEATGLQPAAIAATRCVLGAGDGFEPTISGL